MLKPKFVSITLPDLNMADEHELRFLLETLARYREIGKNSQAHIGGGYPGSRTALKSEDMKALKANYNERRLEKSTIARRHNSAVMAKATMRAYESAGGDWFKAAVSMGVTRSTMRNRLRRYAMRGWVTKRNGRWVRTDAFPTENSR